MYKETDSYKYIAAAEMQTYLLQGMKSFTFYILMFYYWINVGFQRIIQQ